MTAPLAHHFSAVTSTEAAIWALGKEALFLANYFFQILPKLAFLEGHALKPDTQISVSPLVSSCD
jgi:hypothetical protein